MRAWEVVLLLAEFLFSYVFHSSDSLSITLFLFVSVCN